MADQRNGAITGVCEEGTERKTAEANEKKKSAPQRAHAPPLFNVWLDRGMVRLDRCSQRLDFFTRLGFYLADDDDIASECGDSFSMVIEASVHRGAMLTIFRFFLLEVISQTLQPLLHSPEREQNIIDRSQNKSSRIINARGIPRWL